MNIFARPIKAVLTIIIVLTFVATGIILMFGRTASKTAVILPASSEWSNEFVTQDQQGHLSYPSEMTIPNLDEQDQYFFLSTINMALYSDRSSYRPTNYSQDGRIVVASEPMGSDTCFIVPDVAGQTTFSEEETFGNATWKIARFSDAAMGSRWDTTLYRTMRKGTCYEMVETLHQSSDWTDVDERAIKKSKDELRALLDSVVKTFVFGT
jgi:hypothetical protein